MHCTWNASEMRIEDYAIVGDTQTMAMIGRTGSVDWLCFPRFDSPACFAALLGEPQNGCWSIAPRGELRAVRRRYRPDTLVLETEMDCEEGSVRIIDYMPIRGRAPDLVRIVEGIRGRVTVRSELRIRYDYGSIVPWLRHQSGRLHAVAGQDALILATPVSLDTHDGDAVAELTVAPGDRVPFTLTWHPSYEPMPESPDPEKSLADTEAWWRAWAARASMDEGPYREATARSLITLKALTYAPSGGIVAAGTTSLPEDLGGVRNWDYRYCWLRDATLTLQSMLHAGYEREARAWRDWLLRAVGGEPAKLQIMYAVTGERRVDERELGWLPGYEGSSPVRVGNAAVHQRQLDVYGEVMDALYQGRRSGLEVEPDVWAMACGWLDWLESHWREPDEGMWEIRADRRDFTYSKVMVWAAFDRAIQTVERFGDDGPIDRWRALRDQVHATVCARAYDRERETFTVAYGAREVDASLLLMPSVGFLPAHDDRVQGTIRAIERDLVRDGFVDRYRTTETDNIDGLPGREGAFLACSFWLVDALVLANRRDDARALFERLLGVRNEVGLLSEEYDTRRHRLIGNFPQAFSHVGLVNSARNLSDEQGPAQLRAKRS